MKLKEILERIPILPLTALIFYLCAVLLWNIGLIPPPTEVVKFLESLYNNYGFVGLFIATFLEGIVYLGLYFPGSFIIALAVFFSDGSFITLVAISVLVAITLTITSFVNYFLGRHVSFKDNTFNPNPKKLSKGLFLSMLHPNLLAFYFFDAGIRGKGLWKIVFVPLIIIPYGFIFAYALSTFANYAKPTLESPWLMLILILIWLTLAFLFGYKQKRKRI